MQNSECLKVNACSKLLCATNGFPKLGDIFENYIKGRILWRVHD